MISARFARASAIAAGLSFIPEVIMAHVPAYGPKHDMLAPYEDFIMFMKNASGTSCCNKQDGMGSVPEIRHDNGSYTVTIPGGTFPQYPEDLKIVVPPEKVLTTEHARKICAEFKESKTCHAPPFNIFWGQPSTIYPGLFATYCFFPTPQFSENEKAAPSTIEKAETASPDPRAFTGDAVVRPVSVQFETTTPDGSPARLPVHRHP